MYNQPSPDLMPKKQTTKLQQIVIYENPSAQGVAIMACGHELSWSSNLKFRNSRTT